MSSVADGHGAHAQFAHGPSYQRCREALSDPGDGVERARRQFAQQRCALQQPFQLGQHALLAPGIGAPRGRWPEPPARSRAAGEDRRSSRAGRSPFGRPWRDDWPPRSGGWSRRSWPRPPPPRAIGRRRFHDGGGAAECSPHPPPSPPNFITHRGFLPLTLFCSSSFVGNFSERSAPVALTPFVRAPALRGKSTRITIANDQQESLSRASMSREWSGRADLNRGPPAPKAGALPGCATPRLASGF